MAMARSRGEDAHVQPLTVRLAGWALPAILALFIVLFSVLKPDTFPTLLTLNTLLRSELVAAILAIALVFPLVVGEFDLSVGANSGSARSSPRVSLRKAFCLSSPRSSARC